MMTLHELFRLISSSLLFLLLIVLWLHSIGYLNQWLHTYTNILILIVFIFLYLFNYFYFYNWLTWLLDLF